MKKKKKIKISILLLSALILYFSYVIIDQQRILSNKNSELTATEQLIQEELKLRDKLNEQLKTINSDEYIEKAARQKLGLVKAGDRVFVDVNK